MELALRNSNRHLLKISKMWLIRLQVSLLVVPSGRKPRRAFITVRSGSVIDGLIQDRNVLQRFRRHKRDVLEFHHGFYIDCKVANQLTSL